MADEQADGGLTPDSFDLNITHVGGPFDGKLFVWPPLPGPVTDGDVFVYAGVQGYYVYRHHTVHGHDDRLWYVDHELPAGPETETGEEGG